MLSIGARLGDLLAAQTGIMGVIRAAQRENLRREYE